MSNVLMALGAISAVTVGALATIPGGPNMGSRDGQPVRCELKLTRTPHGVQLEALAHAIHAVEGEYQLTVSKSGTGGTSDVSQGGAFAIKAQSASVLGSTEFGLEPGARLKARLILSGPNGQLCAQSVES